MKIAHLLVSTAFVASSAFTATAFAGETGKYSHLDTDGNGMISSEEAAADPMLVEKWETADVNNDGQLERAEISALEQMQQTEEKK